MNDDKVLQFVQELTRGYPRFEDGRIDYTHQRACPVVNCTVMYRDDVLLAHRSAEVIAYPNTWNGISGFIDEIKPLEEIVLGELNEEAGILPQHIKRLEIRERIIQPDESINREWHVFPVLVELKERPDIVTNWENKAFKWIPVGDVLQLELMPGFGEAFRHAIVNQPSA